MSNLYHILHQIPATEAEDMLVEYEELARALIKSGRLRIDAEPKSNFTRLLDPSLNINVAFSIDELTKSHLIENTKTKIRNIYKRFIPSPQALNKKVESVIKHLIRQINLHLPIESSLAMKLSRLLVQSAHPIVIYWLLIEQTEVFISYSYQIGDVMDVVDWKHSGKNSGMQSSNGIGSSIFVSCGGNPFNETNIKHPIYGDGWPAIARLQIIAAQELGHYADIVRDKNGLQIGRHSANFACTRAHDNVLHARRNDIAISHNILQRLYKLGLSKLIKHENAIHFFHKNKLKGIRLLNSKMCAFFYKKKLMLYTNSKDLIFIKVYKNEQYLGRMLQAIIADMSFNLSPVADVYKRNDKEAEEAIACVEALARVPQQVIKWGHITTKTMMANLYIIYYRQVIPSLIQNYQSLSGKKYNRNQKYMPKNIKYFIKKIKSWFTKKSLPSRNI